MNKLLSESCKIELEDKFLFIFPSIINVIFKDFASDLFELKMP